MKSFKFSYFLPPVLVLEFVIQIVSQWLTSQPKALWSFLSLLEICTSKLRTDHLFVRSTCAHNLKATHYVHNSSVNMHFLWRRKLSANSLQVFKWLCFTPREIRLANRAFLFLRSKDPHQYQIKRKANTSIHKRYINACAAIIHIHR